MAITSTIVVKRPDMRETITEWTLDGSYAAGGYAITSAQLGVIGTPDAVEVNCYQHATATLTLVGAWDPVNSKLKLFKSNTASAPTECASGDITSSHKVRLVAKGNPVL